MNAGTPQALIDPTIHGQFGWVSDRILEKRSSARLKTRVITYMETARAQLTAREIEVVRLIARGLDTATIADRLGRSRRTIDATRRRISRKLGTKRVALIVRWAIREGLIEA